METPKSFMNEIFRIVNGALRLDVNKVRNYTAFLAEKLEGEGDQSSARRLRQMLSETERMLHPTDVAFTSALPIDSESRFPLVEHIAVREITEPPLILDEGQWQIVHEFLSIAKSQAILDAEGIKGATNLIIYGPPGTGKSRLARHISKELGLELYIARLDGLISSFLGSTSKNIRALFDFAAKTPCVLFLDEFDAIAKLRGDTQELGELKRVVNSFIQNLDSLGSHSLIVAATNHPALLDSAVWRRFGYRLQLDYPSEHLRRLLWQSLCQRISFTERDLNILVDLSEGFSGADIDEVCRRLNRLYIVNGHSAELPDAYKALLNLSMGEGEERRFLSAFREMDQTSVARALRRRNDKLYSLAALAQLLGVSKATAFRLSQEVPENE